ncbi:MAG: hypothetical protein DRH57_02850 [Candidatus Cloacimonadota bacterium]|nr:MAG: hypothetical protein DRH57_02850 [Candidatus Cloacimonadota bacterium]
MIYKQQDNRIIINPQLIKLIIFDKDGTIVKLDMWAKVIKNRAELIGDFFHFDTWQTNNISIIMGIDPITTKIADINRLTISRIKTEENVTKYLVEQGIESNLAQDAIHKIFAEVDNNMDFTKIVSPIGNIRELFSRIKDNGTEIAIATSDIETRGRKIMQALDVDDYVSAVAGVDSVINDKPAPDMILHICDRLNVSPKLTAIVGDSVYDLLMGHSAGVGLKIAVLTGKDGKQDLQSYADVVINSIQEIDIGNDA